MKIAILHSGDMQTLALGGVDRYIKSLILFSENNEITVFGTTKKGEHEIGCSYSKEYCGKKYIFIPISDDARRPLSLYYMIKEIRWIKCLGQYDCIFAQRTEFSVPFLLSKYKKKLIQMIHGSSKYSDIGFGKKKAKVHLLIERIAVSVASKTFVILNREEFGVPYYKKKYPKYADRIFYGRNPIDVSIYYPTDSIVARKELGLPVDRKILLYSGRIEHNPKRVLLFPDICKEIIKKYSDFLFVIIGEGSDKQELERKIKIMNLQSYFFLPGYIDDPHIIAKYNNASDVAINISIFEGTCTSNLEAVACGLPVVSTDVGDIREVLDGTHNGTIIGNSSDDDTLVLTAAQAIMSICDNAPVMDETYMKYAGSEVMKELRKEMCTK